MSYRTIDPAEARRLMDDADAHTYLDVRSEQEFAAGHAAGALNVPIAHLGAGGMEPNEDFLAVVEAALPKDAPLVVGCKMGGRSARACEILAQAGYTRLHNIDGGFGGRPDAPAESARKGWQRSGLPVETAAPAESTYEHLKQQAGL